jgi:predicted HAD superfamily Cof-like phosphohydrolase
MTITSKDGHPWIVGEYTENKEFLDVKAFNQKFGLLVQEHPGHLAQRKLRERAEFMAEELGEFLEGMEESDLAKMFDALLDIVYVAHGTAVMMGLPWQAGWNEVHKTNMAKVPGMTKRANRVDVTKPPGWHPPRLAAILEAFGYDVNAARAELDDDCYQPVQEGIQRG